LEVVCGVGCGAGATVFGTVCGADATALEVVCGVDCGVGATVLETVCGTDATALDTVCGADCESVGCETVGCETVGCETVGCEAVGCEAEVTVGAAAWTFETAAETTGRAAVPVTAVPSARASAASEPSSDTTTAKTAAICGRRIAMACQRGLLAGPPTLTRKPRTT